MTLSEALIYGRHQLHQSDSPALDARLLLEHVLQTNHSYLVAHSDELLPADQEQHYQRLLAQAARREPIPYLTGSAPFYGRDFLVNSAVLIPRPETELLVESAAAWADHRLPLQLVDVGTGSGCIAITLAHLLPQATVAATDISADALTVARRNAERHQVAGRIHFHQGHLLEPAPVQPHLIVANLPYIADNEWTAVDDTVKWYEPAVALRGGPDGLDLIRSLLAQASTRLAPAGAIFLEIGWQQGQAAQAAAQTYFPTAQVQVKADYAGNDRLVVVELPGSIKM
jgi:release factor glutamine methyltransferase